MPTQFHFILSLQGIAVEHILRRAESDRFRARLHALFEYLKGRLNHQGQPPSRSFANLRGRSAMGAADCAPFDGRCAAWLPATCVSCARHRLVYLTGVCFTLHHRQQPHLRPELLDLAKGGLVLVDVMLFLFRDLAEQFVGD